MENTENKKTEKAMTNHLNKDLLNELENSEMKFFETKKSSIRFCFWAGEELSMSSLRKNMNQVNLQEHEKELKNLQKHKLCNLVLDDGWLHITINESLFTQNFINNLIFD